MSRKKRSRNIVVNDKEIAKNQKFCKNPSFENSGDLFLRNPSKSYLEELQNSLSIVLALIEVIEKYSKNIVIFLYRKVFDKKEDIKKSGIYLILTVYVVIELFSKTFNNTVYANPINSF